MMQPRQAKDSDDQFQLNVELLRCVSHQSDLGEMVVYTVKPYHQCAKPTKTVKSIIRAMNASFVDIIPALFHKLCGAITRTHLENSFQACRPWLKKDIMLLEDVQRSSTKLVKCLKDTENEERVQLLKLDS